MGEQGRISANLKTAIIILSVLLALSLAALAAVNIYRVSRPNEPASIVTDNIISQAEASSASAYLRAGRSSRGLLSATVSARKLSAATAVPTDTGTEADATLALSNRNTSDNVQFQVGNMFPGDSETKYFCVSVTHSGDIVLNFNAAVQTGYDKLAEVLMCRVELPDAGSVLYDGLMRDMPSTLAVALPADSGRTDEVYYRITAYLDTSVGNEYMNRDLKADFKWWIQEDEQPVQTVDPRTTEPTPTPTVTPTVTPTGGSSGGTSGGSSGGPKTGDSTGVVFWMCAASVSLLAMLALLPGGRKEERDE